MKIYVFLLSILLASNFAYAHERQVLNIGGTDYLFVVGSLNESVVVGDKTGIDLKVSLADKKDYSTTTSKAVTPVTGLENTLKVQNVAGSVVKDFVLSAAWGKPGNYTTLFYPTNSNEFSYRVYGKINGTDVDLKFTCNKAGHVMGDMKMQPGADGMMMNGDFEMLYHNGSFGCPKEKEELLFPGENQLHNILIQNIFGLVALMVLLGYILKNTKK